MSLEALHQRTAGMLILNQLEDKNCHHIIEKILLDVPLYDLQFIGNHKLVSHFIKHSLEKKFHLKLVKWQGGRCKDSILKDNDLHSELISFKIGDSEIFCRCLKPRLGKGILSALEKMTCEIFEKVKKKHEFHRILRQNCGSKNCCPKPPSSGTFHHLHTRTIQFACRFTDN